MSLLQRVLSPMVEVRKEETTGISLMFAYAFLCMTAYNIIQPLTRSKLIASLGAVNVPWVIFGSGLIIGVLMVAYTRMVGALPRRWALPITQIGMAGIMMGFWVLFQGGGEWVSVAFYLWGLLLGVLLISQFWTLANGVYDPRQAKRMFGFIGGGVALGGMTGAAITATLVERLGTNTLLLCSAITLVACAGIVTVIVKRERDAAAAAAAPEEERGVSLSRAFALLRESRQIQLIAVVIAFGSLGAALIDQQLNMAAEVFKGRGETDSIGAFLAQVRFYLSLAAFVIQVWITPRIHKYLGIGFALMILPTNLGATAAVIILNTALWAPAMASVFDRSLRYTVDKTTREVLFLPLPTALRQEVKPFVDVTVDRLSRGFGALLMLLLIQPWGFELDWYELSYVSLALTVVWYFMAARAKREYILSFRRSLESRVVVPADVRLSGGDLSTVETLVQELSHTQPARVVYAIDMLESLDKANLVTPLLLYHESPEVRERALRAMSEAKGDIVAQWVPQVRRAIGDQHPGVRAAALRALGAIAHEDAPTLARPMLGDPDARIRATAAVALTASQNAADLDAAEATLGDIVSATDEETRAARREVAAALGQVKDPRFQRLLIPLLNDPYADVADEAMESVRKSGTADFMFVPVLVSLLRNRQLKGRAREVLVSYGEPVIDALAYFMADEHEDAWIRRHVPGTIGMITSQKSVDALAARLEDPDGFLRYKVMSALGRLRRTDERLKFPADKIETSIVREARHFFTYLSLRHNLTRTGTADESSLLATALREKIGRANDRIYQLLALVYPPSDIAAAQWTLTQGDARNRASASEYLDNLLSGPIRKMVMPILEDMPLDERVRRGNVLIRTRQRDAEETLLQLINDDDQVVSASAIDVVRQRRMWSLAGDIEHVLAHRDVRDWFVFEAASWALAEQRMPAERRRELWLEPLPAAVLASELRNLPLFASLSVDELFRIAGASRQVRHEPGTILLVERATPEMIHVLLDGEVTVTSERRSPETLTAPAALGFMEALQSRPMRKTVRTVGVAVTLALTAEELRTQLAYNTELVRGLFATMATRAQKAGAAQVFPTGAAREFEQLGAGGLQPVEKVIALERVPIFRYLTAEEAQRLATITRAVEMKGGTSLFRAADPPATWLVLSGEVQLEATGTHPAAVARGGDAIGSFAALAGARIGQNATVTRAGLALYIDREDLFEMLGDRPDMLKQVFAGIMEAPGQAGIYESSTTSIPVVA
jgi:ATP/ADP translocase/CRP-like cAMP-binding protein/HEAT repeat protein